MRNTLFIVSEQPLPGFYQVLPGQAPAQSNSKLLRVWIVCREGGRFSYFFWKLDLSRTKNLRILVAEERRKFGNSLQLVLAQGGNKSQTTQRTINRSEVVLTEIVAVRFDCEIEKWHWLIAWARVTKFPTCVIIKWQLDMAKKLRVLWE